MSRKKHKDIPAEFFLPHHQVARPIEWQRHFDRRAPLDVEIGFGLGDFLIRQAQAYPERNFVGIEKDGMCIRRTLCKIEAVNHSAGRGKPIRNIRILQISAEVAFERLFRPRSIVKIYSLFPCPWPKKKHIKHRTFSKKFLRLLNSRMAAGGELKIVTDYLPYSEWIQTQIQGRGFQVETRQVKPQYETKYERKWFQGGQEDFYEIVLRKRRHLNVALKEDVAVKDYFVSDFDPAHFSFENTTGKTAVIIKDFIFDTEKKKGMVHLVVSEENLAQHIWIRISKSSRGWKISLAEGSAVLPTQAVARAVEDVYQAACKSVKIKAP